MKYALITLASLTLLTGTAFAQDNNKKWPCIDLHANWQNAPEQQCRHVFIEGEQSKYQPEFQEVEVVEETPVEVAE
jgi:hypothetical protein